MECQGSKCAISGQRVTRLEGVWRFWSAVRWYLLAIFFVVMIVLSSGTASKMSKITLWVVFFILLLLIIMFFSGNTLGLNQAVDPLPPHLGLDGVSLGVKYAGQ